MSIHIKKENRGKFNALKKRTGKSTEELTHSKNPLTRKRAIFAQNAKKWKHSLGGNIPKFADGSPINTRVLNAEKYFNNSNKRLQSGQAVVDIFNNVPYAKMFKGIGEGAANTLAPKDEYGVTNSGVAAQITAGFFNPMESTRNLGTDLKEKKYGQFAADLILPGVDAWMRNKEKTKQRDILLEQEEKDRLTAQIEADKIYKKNIYNSDKLALNNMNLNNNELFMKCGGRLRKKRKLQEGGELKAFDKHAIRIAKLYRNNTASFDSLRTNVLNPALLKKYNLKDINELKEGHFLTKEETNNLLKGNNMYNDKLDYFSSIFTHNPNLGVKNSEFRGSLEDSSNIKDYYYGTRLANFKFPNLEVPVLQGINNEPMKETARYKAYEDNEIKPNYMRKAHGGILSNSNGKRIGDGVKLLTNKSGGISGTHESGDNIPLRKNGNVLAYGEPGELLITDRDTTPEPMILSKRIGRFGKNGISFAKEYSDLEAIKNIHNKRIIEDRQSEVVNANMRVAPKAKYAALGLSELLRTLFSQQGTPTKVKGLTSANSTNLSLKTLKTTPTYIKGKDNFSNYINPGLSKSSEKYLNVVDIAKNAQANAGSSGKGGFGSFLSNIDFQTLASSLGTLANLRQANLTLEQQKKLIRQNVLDAQRYNPKLNKNYNLPENIDISDITSAINQGYSSDVNSLSSSGLDSATVSALKNNANITRLNKLNSAIGEQKRTILGIRQNNLSNIMNTAAGNNQTLNASEMMKLQTRIQGNEQLGNALAARTGNIAGAISETNAILSDRAAMDSMSNRWKNSIGEDYLPWYMRRGRKALGGRLNRKHLSRVA